MADVYWDVLVQILSRLPVKSLLRFKCVSRSWYDLINDPDFIKLHLQRSIQNNSSTALIFEGRVFPYLYSVEFDNFEHLRGLQDSLRPRYDLPYIVGSCNGLLCLTYLLPGKYKPGLGLLYNHATGSYHNLPYLPCGNEPWWWWGYGFGYDSARDDYKVIWIIEYKKIRVNSGVVVMVYSLNDHSWRKGQNFPYYEFSTKMTRAVLVNGYLYWLVHKKSMYLEKRIIGFSISDESYKEVEHPQYESNIFNFELGALDGYLCLTLNYRTHYDLLTLKEHGGEESWTKFLRIAADNVFSPKFIYTDLIQVIGFSKNKRKLFYRQGRYCLASYDLENRTTKRLSIRRRREFRDPHICVESLVSFKKVHP